MRPFTYLLLNSITTVLVLAFNFLAGTGYLLPRTVGEVSGDFPTLITPSGYTFAIWGVIYLGLILFIAFQWYTWSIRREDISLKPSAEWITAINIGNMVWIYMWTHEYIGLSLVVMAFILYGLIRLTIRLRLEIWNAPFTIIAFVWWPIAIYLGWIILAFVANTAIFLVSLGWDGGPIPGDVWAIIVLFIASGIYIFLTWKRNLRESALVGVWGFVGIAWAEHGSSISAVALFLAAVIFVNAGVHAWLKSGPIRGVLR